jgi:hypothetical protein
MQDFAASGLVTLLLRKYSCFAMSVICHTFLCTVEKIQFLLLKEVVCMVTTIF